MAVVEPELLQEVQHCHVGVECVGSLLTVGQTVLDLRRKSGRADMLPPNAKVALAADTAGFRALLHSTLARSVVPKL